MRGLKNLIAVVLLLILSGCSTLAGISDYVNENPLVADIATRQAVARYIEQGENTGTRADSVVRVVTNLETWLDGSPTVTVESLIVTLNSLINWDNLSPADTLLVQDLTALIVWKLSSAEDEGDLTPDTLLGLRSLLVTARRAATLYQ